jgi:Ca2+-transporting ATPase
MATMYKGEAAFQDQGPSSRAYTAANHSSSDNPYNGDNSGSFEGPHHAGFLGLAKEGPSLEGISYAYDRNSTPLRSAGKAISSFLGIGIPSGNQTERYAFSTTLRRATAEDIAHPPLPTSTYPPQEGNLAFVGLLDGSDSTPSALATCQSIDELAKAFALSSAHLEHGLFSSEVPHRRHIAGGPNEFSVKPQDPAYLKFLEQFKEPLIMLLLGSAVISMLMGEWDDAISITLAVVVVITVGFVQEQRSEKSLEALSKLVPHYCHLLRDSQTSTVLANELVPGDVVTFSTGDRVPADVRICEAVGLEIDESTLTGEIKPRKKTSDVVDADNTEGTVHSNDHLVGGERLDQIREHSGNDTSINERENIAFMGTLVRSGYGRGIVVGTGSRTEFGKVFSMVDEVQERRTPLQLSMDELAKKLSMISFMVIGVICIIGVLQHKSWLEMFTIGVSLAVAAIPEGLPIVVTVTLALGVLRMSHRKAIVKRLPSVETLGCVSVVCSDKTGTLTANKMTVVRYYTVDEGICDIQDSVPTSPSQALSQVLLVGNLCNNSYRDEHGDNVGQATDVAMINILKKFGLEDRRPFFRRLAEEPFDSDKKVMSVTATVSSPDPHQIPKRTSIHNAHASCYVKGAYEVLLERCTHYISLDGRSTKIDQAIRDKVLGCAQTLSSDGLRVLALATSAPGIEHNKLTLCGLQALQDPPRPGVKDAVSRLKSGGVQVVMITGDAASTAAAIAKQLGIIDVIGNGHRQINGIVTGKELDAMSQRVLEEQINNFSVFARTNPRHKMRIVEALQTHGHIVAMTGDGVNDAPALKMADIGISMGKGGTDVAKEAADMILVDDNFATILPAVEEGKGIFYNIQNFLSFQLSTAVAALTLITVSTSMGLKLPLNAMQILFINILMDGPPSQSLGVDPVDPAIMKRPPRKRTEAIITKRLLMRVLFSASMIVLGTIWIYWGELTDGFADARDQTMVSSPACAACPPTEGARH